MFKTYKYKDGTKYDMDIFLTRAEAEESIQKQYVEDMACGEFEDGVYAVENLMDPMDFHDERVLCDAEFDDEEEADDDDDD